MDASYIRISGEMEDQPLMSPGQSVRAVSNLYARTGLSGHELHPHATAR